MYCLLKVAIQYALPYRYTPFACRRSVEVLLSCSKSAFWRDRYKSTYCIRFNWFIWFRTLLNVINTIIFRWWKVSTADVLSGQTFNYCSNNITWNNKDHSHAHLSRPIPPALIESTRCLTLLLNWTTSVPENLALTVTLKLNGLPHCHLHCHLYSLLLFPWQGLSDRNAPV